MCMAKLNKMQSLGLKIGMTLAMVVGICVLIVNFK
jgi:hypothetical protein